MSTHHGKDGVVKAGSTTIASVTAWKFTPTIDVSEKSALGDTSKSYNTGLKSGKGTVDCIIDSADTGQEALTLGAAVTLNLYPQGTTTGLKYWSVPALITSIDSSGALTDNSKRSFSFESNGDFSYSTA